MAKWKAGRRWLALKDVVTKDLTEIETSWEVVNMEALNRLG